MERFKYFISIFTICFWLKLGVLHSNYSYADNSVKSPDSVRVASFNIQFGGNTIKADYEAAAFFKEMKKHGFSYILSEEDTGSGIFNHLNTSATEWWVAFYKPENISRAEQLPTTFIATDRTNNTHYERVPYAFSFSFRGKNDAVFISTHLQPGNSPSDVRRRKEEIASIYRFVDENDDIEKDFIILGDMNIKDCTELISFTPPGFISMNNHCQATNTAPRGKPYDHVLYRPKHSGEELDNGESFVIVNLIEAVKPFWDLETTFPGKPYNHNQFRQYFSDHHPISFQIKVVIDDD